MVLILDVNNGELYLFFSFLEAKILLLKSRRSAPGSVDVNLKGLKLYFQLFDIWFSLFKASFNCTAKRFQKISYNVKWKCFFWIEIERKKGLTKNPTSI